MCTFPDKDATHADPDLSVCTSPDKDDICDDPDLSVCTSPDKDDTYDDPDLSVLFPDRPFREDDMMMQMVPCRLPAVSLKVQRKGRL